MGRPKHPNVHHYLKINLFSDLSCFEGLEERISNLKTPKERGEAFEVFAEAYLATQPFVQAKKVWPFQAIPHAIKKRFALGKGTDLGVDGVFQTHLTEG
jgi:hypothetical protein